MNAELGDLAAFIAVARAGGFREAARSSGIAASSLSEAIRRLETKLGVRLLNRIPEGHHTAEGGPEFISTDEHVARLPAWCDRAACGAESDLIASRP